MTSDREPIREPDNSTVDDWLGQRVARDEDLADDVMAESGGDEQAAGRLFEERSDEAAEYRDQHEQSRSASAEALRPND